MPANCFVQRLEPRGFVKTELNRKDAENGKLKQQNDSFAARLNELEAIVKQIAAN